MYDSSGREYLESDFPLYRSDPSSRFLFIRVPSIDGEGGEGNGVEGNGAASSGHSFSASDRLVDVEIVPDIHLLVCVFLHLPSSTFMSSSMEWRAVILTRNDCSELVSCM